MAENNNRNQDQNTGNPQKQKPAEDQKKNISTEKGQDQNSQRGAKWSNYQTRELSDEGYTEENLSDKESA